LDLIAQDTKADMYGNMQGHAKVGKSDVAALHGDYKDLENFTLDFQGRDLNQADLAKLKTAYEAALHEYDTYDQSRDIQLAKFNDGAKATGELALDVGRVVLVEVAAGTVVALSSPLIAGIGLTGAAAIGTGVAIGAVTGVGTGRIVNTIDRGVASAFNVQPQFDDTGIVGDAIACLCIILFQQSAVSAYAQTDEPDFRPLVLGVYEQDIIPALTSFEEAARQSFSTVEAFCAPMPQKLLP
jgi:hypothetical protein